MTNPTAKDVLKQAAAANHYAVQEPGDDVVFFTKRNENRVLVVAFHPKGAVSEGFTRQYTGKGATGVKIEKLPLPRRQAALQFLRGE